MEQRVPGGHTENDFVLGNHKRVEEYNFPSGAKCSIPPPPTLSFFDLFSL